MRLRFGDYQLDSETRELSRRGKPVHLSPKAFRLLELLAENRPRALSKREIEERLWPDTFVSEASLSVLVAELRRAVGETAKKARAIRTVHRFGYAFIAETQVEASAPHPDPHEGRWSLTASGREIWLDEGENLIGRDPGARVQIEHGKVSRRHARIVIEGERARIEDLGSKNGTYVNGRLLKRPARVASGAEILVGPCLMHLRSPFSTGSTRTETRPRRLRA